MIQVQTASDAVRQYLEEQCWPHDAVDGRKLTTAERDERRPVIVEESTIERAECWVFFWQGRRWSVTRDPADMLVGTSPVLVDKRDGSLHHCGTFAPIEHAIRDWEAGLWRGSYLTYVRRRNGAPTP